MGNINNGFDGYDNDFYSNTVASSDANQFFLNSFINWPVDFTSWLLGDTLINVSWIAEGNNIRIENEAFTSQIATAKLTFIKAGVYKVQVTGTSANGQVVVDIDFSVSNTVGA